MNSALKIAIGVGCGILLAICLLVFGCTAMLGYGASKVKEEKAAKAASISVKIDSFAEENDYFKVQGTVTNNGAKPVTFVKVQVDFVDASGTTRDTDWTFAIDSTALQPGASKSFDVMQRATAGVTGARVRVLED